MSAERYVANVTDIHHRLKMMLHNLERLYTICVELSKKAWGFWENKGYCLPTAAQKLFLSSRLQTLLQCSVLAESLACQFVQEDSELLTTIIPHPPKFLKINQHLFICFSLPLCPFINVTLSSYENTSAQAHIWLLWRALTCISIEANVYKAWFMGRKNSSLVYLQLFLCNFFQWIIT